MFRFATTVALLSSLAGFAQVNAQAADFAWEIDPVEDYPIIAFNSDTSNSEVEFLYNFTGTLAPDQKYLTTKLYRDDCVTAAGDSLAFAREVIGNELSLDVDIVQDTITDSLLYKENDALGTSATISFCVRVNYNYKDGDGNVESINFHETVVDINVDLTANFTLTSIATDRTAADAEAADAALDYPVTAYFCEDSNVQANPDPLAQGSVLQVCVKMDDSVTDEVFVKDILTFVVSRPEGPATPSTNIAEAIPDPLTAKDCVSKKDGICNVKTQLPSKYFTEPAPADLQVDGVAILAFGTPERRRLVAVPIQQTLRHSAEQESRQLQDSPAATADGAAESGAGGANRDFKMTATLAKQEPAVEASDSGMGLLVGVVLVILIIIIGPVAYCCCFGGAAAAKKNRRNKEVHYEDGEQDFTPVTRTTMMKQGSQATVHTQNTQAYAV